MKASTKIKETEELSLALQNKNKNHDRHAETVFQALTEMYASTQYGPDKNCNNTWQKIANRVRAGVELAEKEPYRTEKIIEKLKEGTETKELRTEYGAPQKFEYLFVKGLLLPDLQPGILALPLHRDPYSEKHMKDGSVSFYRSSAYKAEQFTQPFIKMLK